MGTPVEDIKSRIDIVEFIGEHIPLKSAGQSFKARCPFHNEKTPSFMVSRERGTWHCFGCGRGGDIFSFLQEMEGLEFTDALRILAKRAGVVLRQADPREENERARLMDVVRWAARYYHEVLLRSREAEAARAYLRDRGLDQTTIDLFGIGYASEAWDAAHQALSKKGYKDEDVFRAGLTIRKERGVGFYDRFRRRIMFPVRDAHGTVIGFGGRVLDDRPDAKGHLPAKYVNTPQTPIYNKSEVLFGYDLAKTAIKQAGYAIVVEGNMDCIASHQFGVSHCVAVSGTALTADQVRLLKRVTSKLIFAFDQDSAGLRAAVRALDEVLGEGLEVAIADLGRAKDPDELIRQSPASWKQAIENAKPMMEYFFEKVTGGKDLRQVGNKKQVVKELLPILGKLGDPVEQSHYLERLGDLVHVAVDELRRMIPRARGSVAGHLEAPVETKPKAKVVPPDRYRAASERVLALCIVEPRFLADAAKKLDVGDLIGDHLQALYRTMLVWYTADHISSRHGLDQRAAALTGEARETYALLSLLADKEYPPGAESSLAEEFLSLTGALTRNTLSRHLRRIEAEIARLERSGQSGSPAMASLLDQARELTDRIRAHG